MRYCSKVQGLHPSLADLTALKELRLDDCMALHTPAWQVVRAGMFFRTTSTGKVTRTLNRTIELDKYSCVQDLAEQLDPEALKIELIKLVLCGGTPLSVVELPLSGPMD